MRIVGGKRFFALVMLMGIFSFLFGCGKTQEPVGTEPLQETEVRDLAEFPDGVTLTGFYMNRMGMVMEPYYILKETSEGTCMKITDTCPDVYLGFGMDAGKAEIQPAEYFGRVNMLMEDEHARLICLEEEAAVRQLEACILKYGAMNWDGYEESVSKKGVSDSGTNYQLYLEFSDGKTVKMRGYNVCPDGFLELYQEAVDIFEEEMEASKTDNVGNETVSEVNSPGMELVDMSLADRICGSYLYRPDGEDTDEEYLIEFRYLDEKLVAEVSYQKDFDSVYSRHMAEFWPVLEDVLTSVSENVCRLAVREFSGFSMAGEYWGPETFVELSVAEDGLECRMEDSGAKYVLERLEDAPKMHSEKTLKETFGQIVEAETMEAEELREKEIFGEWYAASMADGSETEMYLLLEEYGLMWLMRKCEGEPMELYRGAYGLEDGVECLVLHVTAERSGYPYMPMVGMWNLEISPDEGAGTVLKMRDVDDTMTLLIGGGAGEVEFSREKSGGAVGIGNAGVSGDAGNSGNSGASGGFGVSENPGLSWADVMVGTLKITLPESWKENLYYDIFYDENSLSSFIHFYEEPDYLDFGGGWLCSLLQIEGNHPDYYRYLPHFDYLGEVICPDGTVFGVVVEYPTDVQASVENMELYGRMYGEIDQMLAGIKPLDVAEYFVGTGGLKEYLLPFSDMYELYEEDLAGFSDEELRIARNEIYARHGRMFHDQELQAHFDDCDWYEGYIEPEDFDESVLSDLEKRNLKIIEEYEQFE